MKRRLAAVAEVMFFGHPREPGSTFGISVFLEGEGREYPLDMAWNHLRDSIHTVVRDDVTAILHG